MEGGREISGRIKIGQDNGQGKISSQASPSEMGASLASPRSGRAGFGDAYEVWSMRREILQNRAPLNIPPWFPAHLTLQLSCQR